jgi:hypothetical protein
MFDPAGIGAALGSVKAILDLLKNANDAQLAMKALALQNENQELRDEVRRITRAVEEEKSFQFIHGVCWKTRPIAALRQE